MLLSMLVILGMVGKARGSTTDEAVLSEISTASFTSVEEQTVLMQFYNQFCGVYSLAILALTCNQIILVVGGVIKSMSTKKRRKLACPTRTGRMIIRFAHVVMAMIEVYTLIDFAVRALTTP